MINYIKIKETLRSRIWDDLGAFFVDLENSDPRPDTQDGIDSFISHKFTSPYIPGGIIEQHDGETLVHSATPTMTLSLTCYAPVKGDAMNLAMKLRDWFSFMAYEYLKDNDLIVESIEAMSDRTSFLETGYDNRIGFDVILRTSHEIKKDIETIERVELNKRSIEE